MKILGKKEGRKEGGREEGREVLEVVIKRY